MCGSRGSAAHNSGSSVLKITLRLSLGSECTGVVKGSGDAESQIRLEVQVLTLISRASGLSLQTGNLCSSFTPCWRWPYEMMPVERLCGGCLRMIGNH